MSSWLLFNCLGLWICHHGLSWPTNVMSQLFKLSSRTSTFIILVAILIISWIWYMIYLTLSDLVAGLFRVRHSSHIPGPSRHSQRVSNLLITDPLWGRNPMPTGGSPQKGPVKAENLSICSRHNENCQLYPALILGLRPANERRCYFVTTSLIGWVQA